MGNVAANSTLMDMDMEHLWILFFERYKRFHKAAETSTWGRTRMQSALLQVQEAVCNRYGLGVLAAWGRRAYAEMQEEGVYGGSRVYQVAVELNLRALSEEASPVELTEAHSRLRNGEWELSAYDRALRMRLIRYAEEDKILKAKWDAVVQEWRAAIDQEPEDEEGLEW